MQLTDTVQNSLFVLFVDHGLSFARARIALLWIRSRALRNHFNPNVPAFLVEAADEIETEDPVVRAALDLLVA